jgi:hypothetical protein
MAQLYQSQRSQRLIHVNVLSLSTIDEFMFCIVASGGGVTKLGLWFHVGAAA